MIQFNVAMVIIGLIGDFLIINFRIPGNGGLLLVYYRGNQMLSLFIISTVSHFYTPEFDSCGLVHHIGLSSSGRTNHIPGRNLGVKKTLIFLHLPSLSLYDRIEILLSVAKSTLMRG